MMSGALQHQSTRDPVSLSTRLLLDCAKDQDAGMLDDSFMNQR